MATINPCALYQPRAGHSRSSGMNAARMSFPAPDANLSLQITWRPILRKQKYSARRPSTLANERQPIERWRDYLGHVRIDQIATPAIAAYLDKRLKGGIFCGRKLQPVSERTANLDLIMFRNVLKAAIDDRY